MVNPVTQDFDGDLVFPQTAPSRQFRAQQNRLSPPKFEQRQQSPFEATSCFAKVSVTGF
jgi:hypothetical protein